PPCGPTFVSIPVDDWARACEPVSVRQVSNAIRGAPELLAQVGDALDGANGPAFGVGAAVDRDGAWDLAVELAERHGAAVWESPNVGRCSFPESHPLFAGFLPAARGAIVRHLDGYDVVLALGAPLFVYHQGGFGPFPPAGTQAFQLIDDPDVAAWLPTGTSVVTSVRLGLADLLARPAPPARTWPEPRAKPPRIKRRAAISVAYLMQTLHQVRPARSIIVEEAPTSRRDLQAWVPIDRSGGLHTRHSGRSRPRLTRAAARPRP